MYCKTILVHPNWENVQGIREKMMEGTPNRHQRTTTKTSSNFFRKTSSFSSKQETNHQTRSARHNRTPYHILHFIQQHYLLPSFIALQNRSPPSGTMANSIINAFKDRSLSPWEKVVKQTERSVWKGRDRKTALSLNLKTESTNTRASLPPKRARDTRAVVITPHCVSAFLLLRIMDGKLPEWVRNGFVSWASKGENPGAFVLTMVASRRVDAFIGPRLGINCNIW